MSEADASQVIPYIPSDNLCAIAWKMYVGVASRLPDRVHVRATMDTTTKSLRFCFTCGERRAEQLFDLEMLETITGGWEQAVNTLVRSVQFPQLPSNAVKAYAASGGVTNVDLIIFMPREDFDKRASAGEFADGPYAEAVSDKTPYNPHRQIYGALRTGQVVYTEFGELHAPV